MRAVAGLVPHEGRIEVDGERLGHRQWDRRARARLVALVPQAPLIPAEMTVDEYVLLGRSPHVPYFGVESPNDRAVVADAVERLELELFAGRPLGSLSGGEVQRVVLARALAQQAPVLLLDEPTSALDLGHQQRVLELVARLRAEEGLTVLSAMHDLTLAGLFADRLVLMDGGRAVAVGPPPAVLVEAVIAEHYSASVRVVQGDDGSLVVVPVRASWSSSQRLTASP
jgi:iron complex transport system ATP-binding protein